MKLYKHLVLSLIFLLLQVNSLSWAEEVAPLDVSGATTIGTMTAKMLHEKGYPFIDVRGRKHFDAGHIPGAKHLAVHRKDFTAENLSDIAQKHQPVVFYCNGIHCMGSSVASRKAVAWGWTQVAYYRTGIPQWKEFGLIVE